MQTIKTIVHKIWSIWVFHQWPPSWLFRIGLSFRHILCQHVVKIRFSWSWLFRRKREMCLHLLLQKIWSYDGWVAWVVHTYLKNLKVSIATFISTSFSPCSGIAWVHRWMAQAHHNSRLHTFGTLWCGSGNKASRTSWSTTIANGRIPILNHHTLYTQWVSSFKPVSEYLRIVVKFDHLSPQVR